MTDGPTEADGVISGDNVTKDGTNDNLVEVVIGNATDDAEKSDDGNEIAGVVTAPTDDASEGSTDIPGRETGEKKDTGDDIIATNVRDIEATTEQSEDTQPIATIVMHVDDDDDSDAKTGETDQLLSTEKTDDPEATLKQLKDDMQRLDEQEVDAEISDRYQRNRFIFLAQSCLLGISYSIIWPTLWPYMKDFEMPDPVRKLMYGITFVAYPMASILSAHLVERTSLSTKTIILMLGLAEIVGNLVYTLPFHFSLLFVGRLIAGLGDAFYVILMRDMKSKHGYTNNRNMTMECLAAFITGVVVSPGINLITSLIPFKLLKWNLNPHSYPGLSAAVLFVIMELVVLVLLPSQKEKEVSLRSVSLRSSTPSSSSSNDGNTDGSSFGSSVKIAFVSVYSFVYTYTVSYFELTIPIIVYQQCGFKPVGAMILYALLGFMYALILLFGMTISLRNQLEVSIGITVLFKTAAFLAALYLGYGEKWANVLCLAVVLVTLAVLWSHDDILFINLVRAMLPARQREWVHSLRKNISKVAFGLAAVSVPFLFEVKMHVYVVPVLLVLVYAYFCAFVIIRCVEYNKKTEN